MSTRITLIGKPGCHLCDDARAVVAKVAEDTGAGWTELSILDDPDLHERYREQIPVVLVDGAVHDIWRVHEDALRAALDSDPSGDADGDAAGRNDGAGRGRWGCRRRG